MKSWNGRVKSVARAWRAVDVLVAEDLAARALAGVSEPEEDGFMVALEVDVEAVAAVVGAAISVARRSGVERRPAAGRPRWPRLVAEVDPRRDAVEQPAREHRDGDVRRLAAGRAAGLARDDLPAALGVGRAAPEAAEAGVAPGRPARSRSARRAPASPSPSRRCRAGRSPRRCPLGTTAGPSSHGRPIEKNGPTVCGRRGHQRILERGPGRAARCPSGRRAPTRARCGRGRSARRAARRAFVARPS